MEILGNMAPWVLFLLALLLAWYTGYRASPNRQEKHRRKQENDYFIGLNYLLNDEPDDAVDIFINALEVTSGTLETHLALGTLLRRRGKVDRSIAHLQKLLSRQEFSMQELARIKLQLTRSYITAGLLDRAEKLLEELDRGPASVRSMALKLAITVFQMEKDWHKALGATSELLEIVPENSRASLQLQASHFHCELAEQALALGNFKMAREELKQGQNICRHNIRVYLMMAAMEADAGKYREALKILQKVSNVAPAFRAEILAAMLAYMNRGGLEKEAIRMMGEALPNDDNRMVTVLAESIIQYQGEDAAIEFLLEQLRVHPEIGLLGKLIECVRQSPRFEHEVIEVADEVIQLHNQAGSMYRCENCGFELKSLHWLCPGCANWGTVQPLTGKPVNTRYNMEISMIQSGL